VCTKLNKMALTHSLTHSVKRLLKSIKETAVKNNIFNLASLFLSIPSCKLTLFCSEMEHLALINIRAIPACPYRAAVCRGVSPYYKMVNDKMIITREHNYRMTANFTLLLSNNYGLHCIIPEVLILSHTLDY